MGNVLSGMSASAIAGATPTIRWYERVLCYDDAPEPMSTKTALLVATISASISLGAAGCYYPANIAPPPQAKTGTVINVPYDLTWDAVHTVVKNRDYKIEGDDPDHGIVEVESHSFTLADADCGQMKSVGERFDAEPLAGGSAVYNFKVEPDGAEATHLSVNATFTTPLHVPFHPITDFQCVSRGTQEANLLSEVETTAITARRPGKEIQSTPTPFLTPGRPTLLRPGFLEKPGSH